MSRYTIQGNIEDEYEPGGRILKNKLGIRSKREMDRIEYEHLLRTQKHYYKIINFNTQFTNNLISQIHKFWLGPIYEWAGRYRTVNLAKRDFVWPPALLVEKNMTGFESNLLKKLTPCKPASIEIVAKKIAKIHAEFLLIHPFREGNGRLARLISSLMVLQAGYPALDYGFTHRKNRQRYLVAVKKGYVQDYKALISFVIEAIKRSKQLSMG
jgi:cell filamentation protein